MAAIVIDGKAEAAALRAEVAVDVAAFRARHGRAPGLVGIQVGDDPASELYQAGKARAAEEAGMISRRIVLPGETTQAELDAVIDESQRRRRRSTGCSSSCRCPTSSPRC